MRFKTVNDLYKSYVAFKNWDAFTHAVPEEEFAYIATVGKCVVPARILEIGFGNGQFMDWARAQGFQVVGVEIIPEMIDAARQRGHLVFENLHEEIHETFDLVVAIDVLEHIPVADLTQILVRITEVLRPGGRLIARFPNGDSPFNGRYQNGDATHSKPLNAASLSQIAATAGMKITHVMNPRPLPTPLIPRMKRRATYAARDFIEIVLGRTYFGERFPMDPNVLVVMKPN